MWNTPYLTVQYIKTAVIRASYNVCVLHLLLSQYRFSRGKTMYPFMRFSSSFRLGFFISAVLSRSSSIHLQMGAGL